jgi:hypothetical protein
MQRLKKWASLSKTVKNLLIQFNKMHNKILLKREEKQVVVPPVLAVSLVVGVLIETS